MDLHLFSYLEEVALYHKLAVSLFQRKAVVEFLDLKAHVVCFFLQISFFDALNKTAYHNILVA